MSAITKFLETTFQHVRSSHRTDDLHHAILEDLQKKYPEYKKYDWSHEWKLKKDGLKGSFKIDIIGKLNGEIKVTICCKCINSSVGKNIKNYANTVLGEAHRIIDSNLSVDRVLFINIYPRFAPRFKKDGRVGGFDNTVSYKNRTDPDDVFEKYWPGIAEEINIYYDIDNVKSKKHQSEFDVIKPINVTKLELKYAN